MLKLYKYEIPKNGTKVKLINSEGLEYEKTVQEAGALAKTRDLFCFCGIPPQVVMKWTGHSDYKAMRPYIDIAEKTKADAMKLIDDAWGM